MSTAPAAKGGIATCAAAELEALERRSRALRLLHETSQELTAILDEQVLLRRLAERLGEMIEYHRFAVLRVDQDNGKLESVISVQRPGAEGRPWGIAVGHGLVGTAAAERRPIRVGDVLRDPRYVACDDDLARRVRSELAVPLMVRERLVGVLDLESFEVDAFCAEDEDLMVTLGAYVAIALENARLYSRLQADERALAEDLDTARRVQRRLLPRQSPWLPGLQTAVAYAPARHLGGDLYDIFGCDLGTAGVAVGDVAGKGTGAALYGTLAMGALRAYGGKLRCHPARLLAQLNEELFQLQVGQRFLAFAYAVYDASTHTLKLANAGLPYPLLVRGGEVCEIEARGLPLGALSGSTYEQLELALEVDDLVVLLSDGIEETFDARGEPFGERRLHRALEALAGGSAREVADGLLAATDRYRGVVVEPSDDRTVVVLRVGGGG